MSRAIRLAVALIIAPALAAADGALDSHFGVQGRYVLQGNDLTVSGAVVKQDDDRLVVWASHASQTPSCTPMTGKRLNRDATAVDASFGSSGIASACFLPFFPNGTTLSTTYSVDAIKVPGGMIVVGLGEVTKRHLELARFTDAGVLDGTFGAGGMVCVGCNPEGPGNTSAGAVARRGSDGVLVAAGSYSNGDTDSAARMFAFDATGHALTTFTDTSFPYSRFSDVVVQSDGKFVLVGNAQITSSGDANCLVERLVLQSGIAALDNTFNGSGRLVIPFDLGGDDDDICTAVTLSPTGAIVVAGTADASLGGTNIVVARITPAGTLDTSFSSDGKFSTYYEASVGTNSAVDVIVQNDNRILVGGTGITASGSGRDTDFAVVRIGVTGGLDGSFVGTTPGSNTATAMVGFEPIFGGASTDTLYTMLQQNGRLVLYGTSGFPNNDVPLLARLDMDGLFGNGFQ